MFNDEDADWRGSRLEPLAPIEEVCSDSEVVDLDSVLTDANADGEVIDPTSVLTNADTDEADAGLEPIDILEEVSRDGEDVEPADVLSDVGTNEGGTRLEPLAIADDICTDVEGVGPTSVLGDGVFPDCEKAGAEETELALITDDTVAESSRLGLN